MPLGTTNTSNIIHECLSIPEIVALICIMVGEDTLVIGKLAQDSIVTIKAHATLFNLAQTCRAFSEPSLDILWYNLRSLEPLVKCLPRDLWRHSARTGSLVVMRPLLAEDWRILRGYARRARSLTVPANQASKLDRNFVSAMAGVPYNGPLLPNLRRLYWRDGSEALSPLLRVFLGPSLNVLDVQSEKWHLAKEAAMASLGQICPSLSHLNCGRFPVNQSKAIRQSICSLQKLTKVHACFVDRPTLAHLASLHSLTELLLYIDGIDFSNLGNSPSLKSSIRFSKNLCSVLLGTRSFADCSDFLKDIHFSALGMILYAQALGPGSLDAHMFSVLNSFSTNLVVVLISLGSELTFTDMDDLRFLTTIDAFEGLLSCPRLKRLSVQSLCPASMDDNALIKMAKSWPQLTTLNLGANQPWRIPPKFTLTGITSLLEHCPHLESLGLVFLARLPSPFTSEPPKKSMINERITTLIVSASPIEEPLNVAAFLTAILPNVKKIIHCDWRAQQSVDPVFHTYQDGWKLVEDSYGLFLTVRQQAKNQVDQDKGDSQQRSVKLIDNTKEPS